VAITRIRTITLRRVSRASTSTGSGVATTRTATATDVGVARRRQIAKAAKIFAAVLW
jgi:hypothetical protein